MDAPLKPELSRFVEGPAERSTLWVVFSSRGVPPGRFSMTRLLEPFPGDKLYLNCEEDSWYLDVEEQVHARIAGVAAAGRYNRLLFTGTSMGGAAALMFAPRHRPDRVLAFAANTVVHEPLTHSAVNLSGPLRDLAAEVDDDLSRRTTLVLGIQDPADVHTWLRLRRLRPAFELRPMLSGHDTAGILGYAGAIEGVMRAFHAGEPIRLPPRLRPSREDIATALRTRAATVAAWTDPSAETWAAVAALPAPWRQQAWRKLIEHTLRRDPLAAYAHAEAAMVDYPDFPYAIEGLVEAVFRANHRGGALAGRHLADYLTLRPDPKGLEIAEGTAAILGAPWPPDMGAARVSAEPAKRRARRRAEAEAQAEAEAKGG